MKNAFQRVLGGGYSMIVIEYLVDCREFEFTITDICEGTELSRKTVNKIVKVFLDSGLIKVTRTIGRARLYEICKKDPLMKKLMEIDDIIVRRQEELFETEEILADKKMMGRLNNRKNSDNSKNISLEEMKKKVL